MVTNCEKEAAGHQAFRRLINLFCLMVCCCYGARAPASDADDGPAPLDDNSPAPPAPADDDAAISFWTIFSKR